MTTAVLSPQDVPATKAKGRPIKLIAAALVLVLAAGGAGYWFFLKPSGPNVPQPGAVSPLTSIQINLADGHYLRLGMALQLTKKADSVDGSKALDAAISLFSGTSMAQVDDGPSREKLRKQLVRMLETRYPDQVMGVYFTEFVTQ